MNSIYEQKKTSLQDCLDLIASGDTICFAGGCNQPVAFMQSFHTVAPRSPMWSVLNPGLATMNL